MDLLPGVTPDAKRLVATKALRSLGDGFASVALAAYLHERGFSASQVGLLATVALLGTAAATLGVGFVVERVGRGRVLRWGTAVVMASGLAFALVEPYWALLVVAFIGTLNPTSGDVSVFLPVEQAALAGTTEPDRRTWLYARYNLLGRLAAAAGALLPGLAAAVARVLGWPIEVALRAMFALYGIVGVAMLAIYRGLTRAIEVTPTAAGALGSPGGLGPSRGVVLRLSALFALDSFGGGLVVDSLLALWLFDRYGLSIEEASLIFSVVGVLAAGSMLFAAPLAARIGLVNTMVYTHIPANIALLCVPLAPTLPLALVLLAVRAALSQMDVAPRTAYIMAVVTPQERAAAASVTNVSRSLATALAPALGGWLLVLGPFGLPLFAGGALKALYDVLLLWGFRAHPVREEPSSADAVR
jgi:MFS family permease